MEILNVKITPNPVYASEKIKIEVRIYPSENDIDIAYAGKEIYTGEETILL